MKREFLFPLLSAIAIVTLALFISCANTETVEDGSELEAPTEQTEETSAVDEETEEDSEETASEEVSEDSEDLAWDEEEGGQEEVAAGREAEGDELAWDEETEEATGDGEEIAQADSAIQESSDVSEFSEEESTSTASTETQDSMDDELLALGGSAETPAAAPEMTPSTTGSESALAPIPSENFEGSSAASEPYRKSVIPSVPTVAIDQNGTLLNRYYITRKGDSPAEVGHLLYGDSNRASDLIQWNGEKSKWSIGSIVYYQSPVAPGDSQMISFYEERKVNPEPYQVQTGDWLSSIATKKLGSGKSWIEIALVNHLNSADSLTAGQTLDILPKDLSPYGANWLAQMDNESTQTAQAPAREEVAKAPPTLQEEIKEISPQPSAPASEESAEAPLLKPMKKGSPKANLFRRIEENMFFLAIGGVILLLFLSLLAVNKRKRNEQIGDEDYERTQRKAK